MASAFLSPPPPPPIFISSSHSTPSPPPSNGPSIAHRRRERRTPAISPAFSLPYFITRKVQFHSIQTVGRRKLPESVIEQFLSPLRHRDVPFESIESAIASINNWFQKNEFVCSYVGLVKQPLLQSGVLTLICTEPLLDSVQLVPVDEEGKPVSSGKILSRTGTICQALGIRIGDVFMWKAIGISRLMALGLFSFADAEVKVLSNDKVKLFLKLCEGRSKIFEPGAGASSDGRLFADISIVDNNFMGRAQRLRFEWQKRLDAPRSATGFAFEDMRIGAYIPLSFRVRAYRDCNAVTPATRFLNILSASPDAERNGLETNAMTPGLPLRYEKDRDGVLVDIGYRPKENSSLMFNFTPMFENVYANGNGRPGLLQGVLQSGFTHKTRGPVELPRGGHVFRVEHVFGTPLRVETDLFHRIKVKMVHYFSVAAKSSLATRLVGGVGTDNLPWHEQRALGGHATVRGYGYGELGRYKCYGTGRIELRVPLAFGSREVDESETVGGKGGTSSSSDAGGTKSEEGSKVENVNDGVVREKGGNSNTIVMAPGVFERMPALVGVVFGDAALADRGGPVFVGASYGLGIRIGGIMAVDWTSTNDGRPSSIHFSLVDKSL